MKTPTAGSQLKGALLTSILSLGIAGILFPAAPADAAPKRCRGHYETQRVWVPGREQQKRWIPSRWENINGYRRYYPARWDVGRRDQGRYVIRRVWVSNCR